MDALRDRSPGEGSRHFMRGSIILLALRLFATVLILEAVFTGSVAMLYLNLDNLQLPLWVLWLLVGTKVLFLLGITMKLVLDWATTMYYIGDHHLVKYHGILERDENIYNLESLRTVRLHENWFTRLINCGDLFLIFSASGYRDEIWLRGIMNAHHYEQVLRSYLTGIHDVIAAREEEGPAGRP